MFKSFNGLDDSGLIPLVHPKYLRHTFPANESKSLINLKNKAQFWYNSIACADRLIQKNNTYFCILSECLARDMVNKFRREDDGKRRLTIMRPCFTTTWRGYAFTPASPYVEKFDKILALMADSGLFSVWERRMRRPRKLVENNDDPSDKLIKQSLWILSTGYFIAGCVFLLELAFYKCHSVLNRFFISTLHPKIYRLFSSIKK